MSPKCCLMYIYITLPVLILCLIYVFMSTSWSIYLLSVMICFSLLFSFLFCLIIYRLIKMDTIFLFAHFIIFLRFSPRLLLSFRLIFLPIAACCLENLPWIVKNFQVAISKGMSAVLHSLPFLICKIRLRPKFSYQLDIPQRNLMLYAIRYYLYNFKNVKNTHGEA